MVLNNEPNRTNLPEYSYNQKQAPGKPQYFMGMRASYTNTNQEIQIFILNTQPFYEMLIISSLNHCVHMI